MKYNVSLALGLLFNAALLHANTPDATVPPEPPIAAKAIEKPTAEAMRSLAKSICDGDKKAFDVLCATEAKLYRDRMPGRRPVMLAAYDLLGQEAAKGNALAFDTLKKAMSVSGCASSGMVIAAAGGRKEALDILHKEAINTLRKHNEDGLILSSAVGELIAHASSNIEPAVDFLIKVLRDPRTMPLHPMASQGLKGAAQKGNAKAKAALEDYARAQAKAGTSPRFKSL
ncbi:MAG: hypothetical protein RL095_3871 [Verrucomicrobiota bacterium]|jgi:hypothetical protein